MTHGTDKRKEKKRKTKSHGEAVKVTHTPSLVSENKSTYVNNNIGESQVDLEKNEIYNIKFDFSRTITSPQKVFSDTLIVRNSFDSFNKTLGFETFDTQSCEPLDFLEELSISETIKNDDVNMTNLGCLRGHCCSDPILRLSKRVLLDAEIKVFEKGLVFTSVQWVINGPESRGDFKELCRRMRVK